MGNDFDPGNSLQHSHWMFSGLNYTAPNARQVNGGLHNTAGSFVFSTPTDPYGCVFSGNASTPCTEFQADKPFLNYSSLATPLVPTFGGSQFVRPNKKLLAFDQTGGQVNLVPSPWNGSYLYMNSANLFNASGIPYVYSYSANPGLNLPNCNEANGTNGITGEEMHENTDEIDALLYSESDEEYEEASTGHSPVEAVAPCSSEVASSVLPAKRKRVDKDDLDVSVIDTASSAVSSHKENPVNYANNKHCGDDELDCVSSCIKGGARNYNFSRKRLRRARIHETVSVLRRIIPGGRGKDTATILDEAIRYLKALKVKAKSLGATAV